MDRIKQLYGTFNKAEIRALKTHLSQTTKKGENKPLELLQMLEEDMALSAEEAARRLYNDAKSKAFLMMKSRLFHRMTELLGVMADFEVKDTTDAYFKVQLEVRKAMMMATVLRARRLSALAIPILEDALALARKATPPPGLVGVFGAAELGLALGLENVIHTAFLAGRASGRWTEDVRRFAGFSPLLPEDWREEPGEAKREP